MSAKTNPFTRCIQLILVMVMLFSLFACGAQKPAEVSSNEEKTTAGITTAENTTVEKVVEEKTIKFIAWNYYPDESEGNNDGKTKLKAMAELAREWEAKHPGAKIEFIKQPTDDYYTWLSTQLIGDTAPDIIMDQTASKDGISGLVISLDQYLNEPNPYIQGNTKWMDAFYPGPLEILRQNGDGKNYAIAPDQVETAIYYNKEIFEKAGVQPPNTWDEWISIGKKIRDAGYQPLGFSEGPLSWWGIGLVGDMILTPTLLSQLDVLKKDGTVDNEEYARGMKKGIYGPNSPAFKEAWRVYKEWSGIWMTDWKTANALNEFVTGKLAMFWTHSGVYPMIKNDPLRKFEFGTFYIPEITKATSEYAAGEKAKGVGGPSTPYAITRAAEKRGNIDLAVDWLRYITTPENASRYINEACMFIPGIRNAEPNPELVGMMKVLEMGRPKVMMHAYISSETDANVISNAELFMLGKLDLDGFMSKLAKLYEKVPEQAAEQNGWDTGKW